MEAAPLHLRIFLSSPGDVAEERAAALRVLTELPRAPLLEGKVTMQVAAWDDPLSPVPLSAHETPQASVIRYKTRPSECDLTLVILRGRLGTVLPPEVRKPDGSAYRSGTEWELDDARRSGKDAFVYRRPPPAPRDADEEAQQRSLAAFLDETTRNADGSLRGGVNPYADVAEFERLISAHVQAFIGERLRPRTKWRRRSLLAGGVLTVGAVVVARLTEPPTLTLEGTIVDGQGAGIEGARVAVPELGATTSSGPGGHFRIETEVREEKEVEVIVQKEGFAEHPQNATLGNRSLNVRLEKKSP